MHRTADNSSLVGNSVKLEECEGPGEGKLVASKRETGLRKKCILRQKML
jgi:hypothetical protein